MGNYTYKEYVTNEAFYNAYSEYQKKYVFNVRESDRVIIEMVQRIAAERSAKGMSVLDIGCSTGNLLYHLRQHLREARLVGGDLMAYVIDECAANPMLSDIHFEVMDICALARKDFDVIVANAIMYLFNWELYDAAVESIFNAMASGGAFIGYEWMHEYHADIAITEKSNLHPEGLVIHSRPLWRVRESFLKAGFGDVQFMPFDIPIDLPALEGEEQELVSRTVKTEDGRRMMFRGMLYQPWCHMMARKP